MLRLRLIQVVWLAMVAAFLTAAMLMQPYLDQQSQQYELVAPGNVVLENHPEFALLQIAPGGLRAPVVNYLWIRAENLKQEGQYHESMQLSEMICKLQPRFAGVWGYHAWNMAWNISVMTHTPAERWLWVTSGMRLLRDKGIPLNPRSLTLYKDLGWIFFNKMAGNIDDMHMVYKRRWAGEMQRMLGAPPLGQTHEVVEAFRAIANAPLDQTISRQGQLPGIQQDRLAWLIDPDAAKGDPRAASYYDPQVQEYVRRLEGLGIKPGWSLLEAYNQFSRDESIEVTRLAPPTPKSEQEKKISAAINDGASAAARNKLLAFVRAQLLWNEYKMDPQWMLGLMEKFGPLDWRLPATHGLYWVSFGLHVCQNMAITDVDSLNTDRIVLNCLKDLTWHGRLQYIHNDTDPDMPYIDMWADWRFISTTLAEHEYWIGKVNAVEGMPFDQNMFKAGHLNYVINIIQMLYALDRPAEAQKQFDKVKKEYKLRGEDWDSELEQFVANRIDKDGPPIPDMAVQQYTAALVSSIARRAAGDVKGGQALFNYATRVYYRWQNEAVQRLKAPPFEEVAAGIVGELLVNPAIHGRRLDLVTRSSIWSQLSPLMQQIMYDRIAPLLKLQCQDQGLDFDKAFREPPDMPQVREQMRKRLQPQQPRQ